MSDAPTWFRILEVCRELCPDGRRRFLASDLTEAAGFQDKKSATAGQIASAMLGKFVRWGYVSVVGQQEGLGPRPKNVYVTTEKGLRCELKENLPTRFARLLEAVRAYIQARGTREDPAAFVKLSRTVDEVGDSK